ncbi:hypothetical protein NX722_17620 [Endozoicomonas gorgoniicola]|uniref:Uncharacterized protein n=1 Tax=Endozoicomonas gorgoniicola TaxID=1234144 RepID=A0ABT3MYF0_9GAMM|nr:hypothetical protein [Endozoicomonas gorgoniicola]MCW7554406.1 hypothetical protein [Endozoicomonas gorgoniicola]
MKFLFSGVLFWFLIAFYHSALANQCDEIIININGSPRLMMAHSSSGLMMRRIRQDGHNNEQQASGSSTATINNEPVINPEAELTINGLGGFTINSLLSFIEAIGDRTVYITSLQNQRVAYSVVSSQDGGRSFYWLEDGNRITLSYWNQLFSNPESFLGSSQAAEDGPESFYQNAPEVSSFDNREVFLVNPLTLFFNGQWLERFTQFLLGSNPTIPSYHLPLGILYFRTGWTVHLPENNIVYSVMQVGRVLYLNITNTEPGRLQTVNPGDDNTMLSASCVFRETAF